MGRGTGEGRIDGANCKGEAKLNRLREYLGLDRWPGESFAYGDSKSDLPVLRWASTGYLVKRNALHRV